MAPKRANAGDFVGQTINGKYHLLKTVGGGGMGAVYLAENISSKERIAVKVLHPDRQQKETLAKRFMREAQISALLNHPNTISVYDYGQDPHSGAIWLAMEYLHGKTLYRFVRENKSIDFQTAASITFQILSSLGNAHENGIIHRDLKPGNVMIINRQGQPPLVKVLDFGIAKVYDPGALSLEKRMTALTQFGEMLGTPHYMPPEQIRGQELSASADLYALGVILFFMLTGKRPFEDKEGIHVTIAQLTQPFPRLSAFSTSAYLPVSVQQLLDKSSQKEPKDRYQTASDFGQQLMKIVQENPSLSNKPAVSKVSAARITSHAVSPRITQRRKSKNSSTPISPLDTTVEPDFGFENEQATTADPPFLLPTYIDEELDEKLGGEGTTPSISIEEIEHEIAEEAQYQANQSSPEQRQGVLEGTTTLPENFQVKTPVSRISLEKDVFNKTIPDVKEYQERLVESQNEDLRKTTPAKHFSGNNRNTVKPSYSAEDIKKTIQTEKPARLSIDKSEETHLVSTDAGAWKRWVLLILLFVGLAAAGAGGTYLIIQYLHNT